MNLHTLALVTSLFVLLLPTVANAETWTSPDGFLSVTPPDATQFQTMPTPPPPFVGLWLSNDESIKFGVMKTEIPPSIKLIQSSAEEGLAEELREIIVLHWPEFEDRAETTYDDVLEEFGIPVIPVKRGRKSVKEVKKSPGKL